jgi:ABC-type glycerol-3-phosphate transport system permease component
MKAVDHSVVRATNRSKVTSRYRTKKSIANTLVYILLIIGGLVMFIPIAWVLLTSFKTPPEVTRLPITWLPDNPFYYQNYVDLFQVQPFGRYFLNSMIVSVLGVISSLLLATLAAYAFAKIDFKFKEFFFYLILAVFMVPQEAMVLPLYLMMVPLGLVNTYVGLAVPDLFTAFGVYLFRQFMEGIPDDYIDAARVDGASELRIVWQVVLPLVTPAMAAFVIIKFMWAWNQFLWPLIIGQQQEMFTVTVGLVFFAGQWFNDWNMITTATIFSMIPMIVIFILLQRYLVQGIVLSGVKG